MLLLRGATRAVRKCLREPEFQYMLLLRGATESSSFRPILISVSIHAPLARSNTKVLCHGPFGEFQYMLLLRGATRHVILRATYAVEFQYMLLLRGATLRTALRAISEYVSIHAPLARSNTITTLLSALSTPFQYMLLLRGATGFCRGAAAGVTPGFNTCSSCEEQPGMCSSTIRRRRFNTCSSCEEQLTSDQTRFFVP